MTTLYRGIGLPNIVNIGDTYLSNYYLGRRQKLTLSSSEIEDLCANNTYVTRIETGGGNNALSLQFSKNGLSNHLTMSVLGSVLNRDIPITSSMTINYIPSVNSSGVGSSITMQFIGDSFNLERTFDLNLTFDKYAVDPDNDYFDLTTAQKQSIKKIFDQFTADGFNDKYILSKGTLLYLARKSNYQSNSINIKVNALDKAALRTVIENLLLNGFSISFITKSTSGEIGSIKIKDGNARLIIKLCYEFDAGNYYYYGHNADYSQEAKFVFGKDFLDKKKTVAFKTINVTVPSDHVGYLTANYGVGWNTPDPDFDRWAGNATFDKSEPYSGTNLDSTKATVNDIIV